MDSEGHKKAPPRTLADGVQWKGGLRGELIQIPGSLRQSEEMSLT